jgi:hypothetical protein
LISSRFERMQSRLRRLVTRKRLYKWTATTKDGKTHDMGVLELSKDEALWWRLTSSPLSQIALLKKK